MTSPTAARITWLLPDPEAREAYKVERVPEAFAGDAQALGPCMRCGSLLMIAGKGRYQSLLVFVRDRGTAVVNRGIEYIHRGCIPKAGERPQRIRARSLGASQVRATTGEKE